MEPNGQVKKSELPPVPTSDAASFQWNRKDSFYDVSPKEFWGDNKVTQNEVEEFKKCEHYFEYAQETVKCKKCSFGMNNSSNPILEIQDGKLFVGKEPIEF